jgi:iron-sulfur cluster repair protein YtfE (RIC family)
MNSESDARHEQIQREHEELRGLLGEIHRVLSERLESVANVSEMLASLSKHIETHFSEEEVDGFFDDIVEQAPRLSTRTSALRNEHVRLLESVRALAGLARSEDCRDWWEQLERKFHTFSKELMQHEGSENELLQDSLEDDIGAQD